MPKPSSIPECVQRTPVMLRLLNLNTVAEVARRAALSRETCCRIFCTYYRVDRINTVRADSCLRVQDVLLTQFDEMKEKLTYAERNMVRVWLRKLFTYWAESRILRPVFPASARRTRTMRDIEGIKARIPQ